MSTYSCYLCDAKVPPTQRIDLGREHCVCTKCDEALRLAQTINDPRFSREPGKVRIDWAVDGEVGSSNVDRGRLVWELSAHLRGGFTITGVEAL